MVEAGRPGALATFTRRLRAIAPLIVAVAMAFPFPLPARAAGDTVLTIGFITSSDRLYPDPRSDIIRSHQIVATLSDNKVHENVESAGASRGRRHGGGLMQDENNEKLGDNEAKVVWRVLGPNKLQRIFPGRQFLQRMDVDIGSGNTCSVEVKFLLQSGFTDIVTRRADNHEMAHFSLPKVLSAECSIR